MTSPWPAPDPNPLPTGPRTWPASQQISDGPMVVALKPCCGALEGDWCGCADDMAELLAALSHPIVLPAPQVDPALRRAS